MTASATYGIVADFLASMDTKRIISFHAPDEMQKLLDELIMKEKEEGELTKEDKDELDHYIVLERV